VADLAATIHGVSKDDLESDDVRQHKRALRLARSAVAVLAVLLLAAVIGAVVAVRSAREANRQTDRATAQALAAGSVAERESGAPDTALLLGIEATRHHRSMLTRSQLLQAAAATPPLTAYHREARPVTATALTTDGSQLVIATEDGELRIGELRRSAGRLALRTLARTTLRAPAMAVAYDGRATLLAVLEGLRLAAFEVDLGQGRITRRRADLGRGTVWDVAYSPFNEQFYIVDERAVIVATMSRTLEEVSRLVPMPASEAVDHVRVLGPDRIAVLGPGYVQVWNVTKSGDSNMEHELRNAFQNLDAALDPAGRHLLVGSGGFASSDISGSLNVWDLESPGGPLFVGSIPSSRDVLHVERCGSHVLFSDRGSTYVIGDVRAAFGSPPSRFEELKGFVRGLSCARDRAVLATSDRLVELRRGLSTPSRTASFAHPLLLADVERARRPEGSSEQVLVRHEGEWLALRLGRHGTLDRGRSTTGGGTSCHARRDLDGERLAVDCGALGLVSDADAASVLRIDGGGGEVTTITTRRPIHAVALDDRRDLLFIGHRDYAAVLWDVSDLASPSEILEIDLPVAVVGAAFSGDGELLAVEYYTPPGPPTGVLVFGVGDRFLEERGCAVAGRQLTRREVQRFSGSSSSPRGCRRIRD
jgi:hypothetical protein